MTNNAFLFTEKYRPRTIDECILPPHLKTAFNNMVEAGEITHMLLIGGPGTGKTTVAKALCNQLDLDYMMINASEEGNIDTLRGKIKQFASSVSLSGGYKIIILDEADYLNPQSTQPALRNFMEEFSSNCRFILTANFTNKIIDPLRSRCAVYDFNLNKADKLKLTGQFIKRVFNILTSEGVDYDKDAVLSLVARFAPDWRRVLNEIQRQSQVGSIRGDNHAVFTDFDTLFKALKGKNFKDMRTWAAEHSDVDSAALFRGIFDRLNQHCDPKAIPQIVVILAQYQYWAAFVADHELNLVACLTEVMAEGSWK